MASEQEREIRDYAVSRLREMMPQARIIHELVVGGCRADLAAVEPECVTLVEIKSQKDTLKRLPSQIRQFERAAHRVIVIAHERWWDQTSYNNGTARFVPSFALSEGSNLADMWAYPEDKSRWPYGEWRPRSRYTGAAEPHAARLLDLCWRAELVPECKRHGVPIGSRDTIPEIIKSMAWHMTGRDIARAVCRQLRARHFPEADPAIIA